MTAPIDTKTFTKATADTAVTTVLACTFAEQQYIISRLRDETPYAFAGNASLPEGASTLKGKFT